MKRKQTTGQQRNLDQEEFDRQMALMSEEQLTSAVKGLAALARATVPLRELLRDAPPGRPH